MSCPTKKLKVGIAGYGMVGKRRKLCVDKNPFLELVAVCDKKHQLETGAFQRVQYFTDYTELLKAELDILIVCLTNDLNAKVTAAGLAGGLHVFCEKPPGRNLDDMLLVIRAERKAPDCRLMYGFNHRYHQSVHDALNIVRSNELGRVIHLRGVYGKSKLITFDQTDWRTKRAIAGGGVLLDQGIHMVDLMRLFGGEFTEIQSIVDNSHWGFDVEDNAYALMRTKSGIVALLHSSATQWRHRFHLDINLEKGSLILGGLLTGTKSYGDETLTVVRVDHSLDRGEPREQLTRYNHDPSWELEIECFVNWIMHGKKPQHGSSQDALRTMQLVQDIYYSDQRWRKRFHIQDPSVLEI